MVAKIAIQASVYATALLMLARLISRYRIDSFIARVSGNKSRFWWTSGSIISFSLFAFAFSYWGDHGLGDSSRIPVGYGQYIRNGDGVFTYFYTKDNRQRQIYRFQIREDLLFAEQNDNKYLVFNFKNSQLLEFDSIQDYERFARRSGSPATNEFRDFKSHYDDYWNGWRFWCLG